MSQAPDQPQPLAQPRPVAPAPPPPPPRGGFPIMGCFFGLSFLLNLLLMAVVVLSCMGFVMSSRKSDHLTEKHLLGSTGASDKVAVVSLEGAIMEGMLSTFYKQLEHAASDDHVKAVVLRINSPGGTITASEEIRGKLIKLRDGDKDKERSPKTLVVSMASIAASGGYYVAMPASRVWAEPATITGSIGVYISLPNVAEFGKKHGITFDTIKAGEIKALGAMFGTMSAKERVVVQDMVDASYIRFLDVIEKGRPRLTRARMLERFEVKPLVPDPKALGDKPAPAPYQRYRADGGVFTAQRALDLGLIDAVGSLEDSVKEAAKLAKLDEYNAVQYKKPITLTELLMDVKAPAPPRLSLGKLSSLLSPRLWYLAPGYEAAARLNEEEQP